MAAENGKQKRFPSLPSNYVTLAQLQERWLKQQRDKANGGVVAEDQNRREKEEGDEADRKTKSEKTTAAPHPQPERSSTPMTDHRRETEEKEVATSVAHRPMQEKKKKKKKRKKRNKAKENPTLTTGSADVAAAEVEKKAAPPAEARRNAPAESDRVWKEKVVAPAVVVVDRSAEIEGKNVQDDQTAEIGQKLGEISTRDDHRAENGRKLEVLSTRGDRRAENEHRRYRNFSSSGRKGGSASRGSGRFGGRFGKMQKGFDSSLVWVRKEDKSDACVAGNCREGVLAKAGEDEKKPNKGRP